MNHIGFSIYLICYALYNKMSYPKNGYADVCQRQIDVIVLNTVTKNSVRFLIKFKYMCLHHLCYFIVIRTDLIQIILVAILIQLSIW